MLFSIFFISEPQYKNRYSNIVVKLYCSMFVSQMSVIVLPVHIVPPGQYHRLKF